MTPTTLPWAHLSEADRERDLFLARLAELADIDPNAAAFVARVKRIARTDLEASEWRSLRGYLDDYEHAHEVEDFAHAAHLAVQVVEGVR